MKDVNYLIRDLDIIRVILQGSKDTVEADFLRIDRLQKYIKETVIQSITPMPIADAVSMVKRRFIIREHTKEELSDKYAEEAMEAIETLIRAASTPSPEAQAVSEVTVEELMHKANNPPYGDAAYESRALAQMIRKEYPSGLKIKAGGE